MNSSERRYISIQQITDQTGYAHPQSIILEDGRVFKIERIKSFRPSELYSAYHCDCYKIVICGRERLLYYEPLDRRFGGRQGRWFIQKEAETSRSEQNCLTGK